MSTSKAVARIVLVCCSTLALTSAADAEQPLRIYFDKTAVGPGLWKGSVTGDATGSLTTELLNSRTAGPGIVHVEFRFTIEGSQPTHILLNGILNMYLGQVVMNGHVVEGALKGAKVHESGQLIDLDTQRFVGLIQVMPSNLR